MIDSTVASNGNYSFYVSSASTTSYPTQFSATTTFDIDNDDITIITSNMSSTLTMPTHALAAASFTLTTKDAIADSSTTQIFIMENTPFINECVT
jgi:hypothetical protein